MIQTRRLVSTIFLVMLAVATTSAQGRGAGTGRGTQRGEFQVSSRQQWMATGIVVQQGQALEFESAGEITLNQNGSLRASPAGATNNQFDRNAPLSTVPVGALIGRIGAGRTANQGTSRPFAIGDRRSVVMPASGELFLSVNDSALGDNGGAFTVSIGGPRNARGRANRPGREFQITARQQWTPTGIVVRQGQTVEFDATGEVTLNQNGSLRARPAGATNNQFDRNAPLSTVPVGALIGRIGAGRIGGQGTNRAFAIGDDYSVVMPGSGELFLGVNDSELADNGGAFAVWVDERANGRDRGRIDSSQEFQVPARQQWTPTGIVVRQGEVIQFEVTGEVTLNQEATLRARSAGARASQFDPDSPMPNSPVGALIGRIGTTGRLGQVSRRAFLIGDQQSVVMPSAGELMLGVNDGKLDDNGGTFIVRLQRR